MIFAACVVPIGKLFEKIRLAATAECPLSREQRKTFARFEFFRF
jgi:hypothetical protein